MRLSLNFNIISPWLSNPLWVPANAPLAPVNRTPPAFLLTMASPSLKPTVTQLDIAREAGVSVMTVSLALRHQPGVSAAKAQAIRELAQQRGYRPDPALSALVQYRGSKSKRIKAGLAFISGWETREKWLRSPVGGLAWNGAKTRAEEFGYSLEHFWIGENGRLAARTADILRSRGIRGLVLAPIHIPWRDIKMPWAEFAAVTLERNADFPHLPHVSPNHYADMFQAWARLIELGYRRIGLAAFSWLSSRNQHRWEAAQHFQQSVHFKRSAHVPDLIIPVPPRGSLPTATVDSWLKRHRPDVVLSPCSEFREAILASGRTIPSDVAFASLQIQLESTPVAGINQHRDQMGAACIDLIHARLLRSDLGIPESLAGTTIGGDWVDGPTAPPCRTGRTTARGL